MINLYKNGSIKCLDLFTKCYWIARYKAAPLNESSKALRCIILMKVAVSCAGYQLYILHDLLRPSILRFLGEYECHLIKESHRHFAEAVRFRPQ